MYGDLTHLTRMTSGSRELESGQDLLSDIFGASSSIRQPEFYATLYDRIIAMIGRMATPLETTDSTKLLNYRWPVGLALAHTDAQNPSMSPKYELLNLVSTKQWLFEQTLSDHLLSTIVFCVFPKFLWHVYDELKFHESKYEENFFNYLWSKTILGTLAETPTLGEDQNAITHTSSRWWLMYAIKSLSDEMPHFASECISKLGLTSSSVQVSKQLAVNTFKESFAAIKNRARKHVLECIDAGMGTRIYEFVRPLLDEYSMVRHSTAEPARIEIGLDSGAAEGKKFSVVTRDRSIWYTHLRRIADSHLYQAYCINDDGVLEPQLASNELSEFITGNLAFSNGDLNVNAFEFSDFLKLAVDGKTYIDVGRVSGLINENGFNVPHTMDGMNIIYSNNTKDLIFSCNPRDALSAPLSAMDLDQKIKMQHLYHGSSLTLGEQTFEFSSAVTAELGMIFMQRFFAMLLPETSPTGAMVTSYDNVHGTVLIDGSSIGLSLWITEMVMGGAGETLYNATSPILSFLSRLRVDGVPISNNKEVLVGSELIKQFYSIANTYGFGELKTQMLKDKWSDSNKVAFPTSNKLIGGWTSSYGQSNMYKGLNGYGSLLKEAQCIKHLFATISSSSLLDAFVRSVSLFIGYDMTAVQSTDILKEFKKTPVQP